MKIIKDFSILLVSVVLFFTISHIALAEDVQPSTDTTSTTTVSSDTTVSTSDLDVANVGTLPTSRFYFLKEWVRNVHMLFTFNAAAKTQLALDIANEKAAEVVAVQQQEPDDQSAIQKAIDNYTASQEKLKEKLASLQGNSNDPKIASLIANIDARLQKHEQVFEKLATKDSTLAEKLQAKQDTIQQILSQTGDKDVNIKDKAEEAVTTAEKAVTNLKNVIADLTAKGVLKIQATTTNDSATFNTQVQAGTDTSGQNKGWLAQDRITKLTDRLAKARQAFDNAKYGEAFGLAVSVRVEAEAMLMHIKRLTMMPSKEKTNTNQGTNNTIRKCLPRPACLDATPRCMIPEPAGGWCPPTAGLVCPELAPSCGSVLADCLKAALALDRQYPHCEYARMCKQCNYAVKSGAGFTIRSSTEGTVEDDHEENEQEVGDDSEHQ